MADKPDPKDPACPVDHKTRAAWLEKTKAQQQLQQSERRPTFTSGQSCDSNKMDQTTAIPPSPSVLLSTPTALGNQREVSSIPRAFHHHQQAQPGSSAANNEAETGTSTSGHWIYPSERMFFDAMKRKNFDARAEDMRAIIPIHNAVNEKAWQEILAWEKGKGGDACGGPRLLSFSGLSTQLTPRAWFNTLLGYQAPFDRHDWIVDRCGTQVDYVIDFYSGKDEGKPGKPLNFYLDVRPKLNTWEGWRMRLGKLVGL